MKINYDSTTGLVPAIIQDVNTKTVLMLGYMNEEALNITNETGKVTFFSRSRNQLWTKGETSGNFLLLKSIAVDCDSDALLIQAEPTGPVCHTGSDTCWNETNTSSLSFLNKIEAIISDRKENPDANSYTSSLFTKGINKVAQKVGEEAVELVIEAKDSNNELFVNEAADLLFHFLILLKAKNMELADVIKVLEERNKHSKDS